MAAPDFRLIFARKPPQKSQFDRAVETRVRTAAASFGTDRLGGLQMNEPTTAEAAEGGEKRKRRSGLWLLLLLLLLIAAGVTYYISIQKPPPPPDGSFRTGFKGCDNAGNCADFTIYAPGFAYAWEFDKAVTKPIPTGKTPFDRKIETDLKDASAVVVVGVASQEGGEDFNRWLAACRANAFEGMIAKAQGRVGGRATLYRASLGRYRGETPLDTASLADGSRTQVQRLLVMAFVSNPDPNTDLAAALRDGIEKNLSPALEAALPEVARQLDFEKYSCWGEAFQLTTIGGAMGNSCYPEPSDCSPFN